MDFILIFLNGKMLKMFSCIHLFSIFIFLSYVSMSDHNFVLSDKSSDLAGHLSFQNKKYILAALHCYGSFAIFVS